MDAIEQELMRQAAGGLGRNLPIYYLIDSN